MLLQSKINKMFMSILRLITILLITTTVSAQISFENNELKRYKIADWRFTSGLEIEAYVTEITQDSLWVDPRYPDSSWSNLKYAAPWVP